MSILTEMNFFLFFYYLSEVYTKTITHISVSEISGY